MSSDLAVVNEALIRIGVPPIASFSEQSAQALTAESIYRNVVDELLSDHPWYFALRETALAKIELEGSDKAYRGYKYTYQLPADLMRVLGLKSLSRFELAGDQLYTDDKDGDLVYIRQRDAQAWPPHFRRLVVFELASAFAITLTDSTQRAQLMQQEAARYRPRARSIDSQQTPPQVFDLMRIYQKRSGNPLARA